MDCKPTITSNGKLMVYFKWLDITLTTISNCTSAYGSNDAFFFDYVALNDGVNEDVSLLGGTRFCGYTAPKEVFVTSGSFLTINFHGYYYGGGKGFNLNEHHTSQMTQ